LNLSAVVRYFSWLVHNRSPLFMRH
jgi:hypothetical protein